MSHLAGATTEDKSRARNQNLSLARAKLSFSTNLCRVVLCPHQRCHSRPKLSGRFPVSAEIPTASFGWVGSQVFSRLRCHRETSGIRVILLLSGLSCHQRCDDCALCEQVTAKERRGVRAVFISLYFNEETGAAVSITRGCISHKSTLK